MANLTLATAILPQRIVIGSQFELDFHVHESGQNFNWSGYTPKATITIGPSVTTTITGTVVNQGGGTAKITLSRAQTVDWRNYPGTYGEILLFAYSAQTSRAIAVVPFQISVEEIP